MSDQDKRPNDGQGGGEGPQTGIVVKARPRTKKPAMYKVLMLNDDYTPMEFVVHVLERFFQKNREEATRIMLHVHRRGVGRRSVVCSCGTVGRGARCCCVAPVNPCRDVAARCVGFSA